MKLEDFINLMSLLLVIDQKLEAIAREVKAHNHPGTKYSVENLGSGIDSEKLRRDISARVRALKITLLEDRGEL